MNPLINSLKKIKTQRYHMPGHKGKRPENFPDVFQIDFTETSKTGNLFIEEGAIFESQQLYASYFGAKQCIYLTGGATQGIYTAIFTLNPKKMLCDRNSHKSLCNIMSLLDIHPEFINPNINSKYDIPDVITCQSLEEKLIKHPDINVVFITSPNYYGIYSDITSLSKICKKYNAKLIVDEAHGCHFPAVCIKNAIMCGADIAITSAHKTTQSLGQGAVLLSREKMDNLRENCSIFGTSSPSYAILCSIEMALSNISNYSSILPAVSQLKNDISCNTIFSVVTHENIDPCRLTINTKNTNISAPNLMKILENTYSIIPEMCDKYNVVFIITPQDDNLAQLLLALIDISKNLQKTFNKSSDFVFLTPKRAISLKQAMFSPSVLIDLDKCEGKISKNIIAPYPPGVPIIYPGEIIFKEHIEYIQKMCYTSFNKLDIIEE